MRVYYKCRLCLEESRQNMDIFKEDFAQMIEILTGLKVNLNDRLPKTSCLRCYREVKTAMLTRYQIINSHKILLEELNTNQRNDSNDIINAVSSMKNEAPPCNDVCENVTNASIQNQELGKNSMVEDDGDNIFFYSTFGDDFNEFSNESYPECTEICIKEDLELANNTKETKEGHKNDRLGTTDEDNLIANAENIIKAVKSNPSRETENTFKKLIKMLQSKDGKFGPSQRQEKQYSDTKKKKEKKAKASYRPSSLKKKTVSKESDSKYRVNVNYGLKPEHVEYLKSVGKHVRAKCPICSKEILGGSLKNHLITHTYDPTPCHLCGKTSKNAQSLQDHINYYHKITADGVICDQCGKCFKVPCFLEKHKQRQHQGCEKSFECHVCGKRFYEKIHLKNHINITHNKIKPFKCEHCGKDFGRRTQFVTHQLVHTKENRYHCQVCGKGFKIKQTMQTHLKGVHGIEEEKTIFCKICQKGFSSAQGLRAHVNSRVHGLEKCEHCTEFITLEYKHIHLKEIHGIESRNVFS